MSRSAGCTLLVFVKAPSTGEVKTRLMPALSASQVCRLYRCLVQDTLAVARKIRGAEVVLVYAANRRFPDCAWLDATLPMVLQEGRGLGERLARAFGWAFHRRASRVIALGSDAPQLSAAWLRQACEALARADVVLGPTVDGGYHLIGLQDPQPALFTDMPWSTGRLLARTLERVEQLGLTATRLALIRDLDTPEDLRYFAGKRMAGHTGEFLKELRGWRGLGRKRLENRGAGPIAQDPGGLGRRQRR